jgi:hypothetical protein
VFPVRYELNFYILFRRNSVFKGLRRPWDDAVEIYLEVLRLHLPKRTEEIHENLHSG